MVGNKDRVYIALYARGGKPKMLGKEDMYHWAILVGPKTEGEESQGVRYHAKQRLTANGSEWYLEEKHFLLVASNMLLVRVMIGKVEDSWRFTRIVQNTPIRSDQQGWNCVNWVKEALEALQADGKALGTGILNWERVRKEVMKYCQRKKDQHRFDGKGSFDLTKVATSDLLQEKETIP